MQLPQTTFSGNLAALRMLVVHGNVFAVAAVADIRDESSGPASAVTDASMYILGTRAQLRLYSPLSYMSLRFYLVIRFCFLLAVTLTSLYRHLLKKRFVNVLMNLLRKCDFQYFQFLLLPSTVED